MWILFLFLSCVLSAILYRMGGAKGYDTLWRDIGCSLVLIGLSMLLFGVSRNWWAYVITFGLSWGALSTYWDEVPFNNGVDNFFMHGFFCGLAAFPLLWAHVPWQIFLIRIVLCTLMGVWQKSTKNDVRQELGRGVLFIL